MPVKVTILLFALILTACVAPFGAAPTCAETAGPFITQLQSIAREWDDANKLAGTTPRASLAAQIQNLQAIRRKVQDVQAPECAKKAQTDLIASMDATIEAYLLFLGQKPDTEVTAKFTEANTLMDAFTKDVITLSATATP